MSKVDSIYFHKFVASPLGELTLVASDSHLVALLWPGEHFKAVEGSQLNKKHALLCEAEQQLSEYFAGSRRAFKLPLEFRDGTQFQIEVWQTLTTIPYGETRSYAELAQQIGRPKACRAVGAANGRNPLAVIVPCHRVIGANGTLTGFAAGLDAKRYLLSLEQAASFAQ